MASPGRVVTKNGKAVYEPLMYDDDRDAGPQESYGVKNCYFPMFVSQARPNLNPTEQP